jgi:hypothetical protein
MPETPTPDDFGVFNPIFASAQGYLPLLSLTDRDAKLKVRTVLSCLGAPERAHGDISPLFDGLNWRPHLVGAVALAKYGYERDVFRKVWEAIDHGSWVTPQLVAVAFWHDPEFAARAVERLSNLNPEPTPAPIDLKPEEHAGLLHLSPKAAASMVRLLSTLPVMPAALESPEMRRLLLEDYDGAGTIAEEWLKRLMEIIPQI